jgi:thioredoxin-related protein
MSDKKLVIFTGAGCQVCKPYKDRLGEFFQGIPIEFKDVMIDRKLASELHVRALPTTYYFVDEKVKGSIPGAVSDEILKEMIGV